MPSLLGFFCNLVKVDNRSDMMIKVKFCKLCSRKKGCGFPILYDFFKKDAFYINAFQKIRFFDYPLGHFNQPMKEFFMQPEEKEEGVFYPLTGLYFYRVLSNERKVLISEFRLGFVSIPANEWRPSSYEAAISLLYYGNDIKDVLTYNNPLERFYILKDMDVHVRCNGDEYEPTIFLTLEINEDGMLFEKWS
jgi:hypothetical protein